MIPLSITGGQYQSKSLPISNQQLVNWYVGLVQTLGLSQEVLFGTPGLTQIAATDTAPNRGSHTKEGIPYFVNGTELWNVTESGGGYTSTNVTGLVYDMTGSTRVSMADNGTQLMVVANNKGYIYDETAADFTLHDGAVDNNDWNDIAFGEELFVAVGSSDLSTTDGVMTSLDGKVWTQRIAANSNNWTAIAYGQGEVFGGVDEPMFVAVSDTGTGNRVMTSPDAIIWTERVSAADHDWCAVAYSKGQYSGDDVFIAISRTDNSIMYSLDKGVTWTLVAHGISGVWNGIEGVMISTSSPSNRFVAVGDSGITMYSNDDGATWTSGTMPSGDWEDVVVTGFGGSATWIACSSVTSVNSIATSTGGIAFSASTLPDTQKSYALAFGGTLFGNEIIFSAGFGFPNRNMAAITPYTDWLSTISQPSPDIDITGMVYGNGLFVAVSGTDVIATIPYGGSAFYPIDDSDFYANGNPKKVEFVDSYFIVSTDDKKVIQSAPNDGANWNALDFGSAEADPDGIQDIKIENNDSYLFGTETIEVFQNIGGSGFVFQRNGLIFNKGASSQFGNINTVEGIAFLGAGENESPTFWLLTNNQLLPISDPAIDHEIGLYSLSHIEACFAQYYSEAGEYFVSFTFPLKTFVYGMTSKRWHERSSDDAKWRVNSITKAYGILMAGDSEDGRIGQLCIDIYGEYDADVTAIASSPNFANAGDTSAWTKIEATFNSGQGNADTPNPTVTMEYADDANTFVNPRSVSIGAAGAYGVRAQWRRNGRAQRYRTVRFTYTGQSNRDFIKLEADIVG